ncbi:MAG TPA: hypothetical protein VFB80_24535 [Pirellulaceae bacterium]|nr:hypothetical protein [Pirellulaceae bacterium]
MSDNPYESPQTEPRRRPRPPILAGVVLFAGLAVVALLIAVAVVCVA